MGLEMKAALANIDLSKTDLDAIEGLDPQMLNALRKVKDWGNETVAHQNHNSHGDSHGSEKTIEREEINPVERITPAEKISPSIPESK